MVLRYQFNYVISYNSNGNINVSNNQLVIMVINIRCNMLRSEMKCQIKDNFLLHFSETT